MKLSLASLLILPVVWTTLAVSPSARAQTEDLFHVLKNSQNRLVDGALRDRLALFAAKAPVQFEFLTAVAQSTSPHAHEVSRARYQVADPTPFWEIISSWISAEDFDPRQALVVSQIAKFYAIPRLLPTDVKTDDETLTHKELRFFLVGQFYRRSDRSNLTGVKSAAIIRALPLFIGMAQTSGHREFGDFQQTIKTFSRENDWNQIYFLIALNSTLEILGELDRSQVGEGFEVLAHFSADANEALKKDSTLAWSETVRDALRVARANRAQRCAAPMTLSLFENATHF